MILDGLSLLIVNGDLGSRSRLREVIKNCIYKAELSLAQTCKEGSEAIALAEELDVVLISFNFGEPAIRAFIKESKDRWGITCPLFIVTIEKQSSETTTKVTSLYLEGASGFITEPYSPEELTTLLEMVHAQRKKVNAVMKQRKVTQFLLAEAIKRIDDIAKLLLLPNSNTSYPMRELKHISESIKIIFSQDPQGYAEMALEVFEKVPPPAGGSTRHRHRQKKKHLQHPGKIIGNIMKERQLTFERLQPSIKVDLKEFQRFLDCARGIDDEFSRELSRLFGRTSTEWLKLQKEYDFYIETTQSAPTATQT